MSKFNKVTEGQEENQTPNQASIFHWSQKEQEEIRSWRVTEGDPDQEEIRSWWVTERDPEQEEIRCWRVTEKKTSTE